MSLTDSIKQVMKFTRPLLVLACIGLVGSVIAQAPEPDYQFQFIANKDSAATAGQSGTLQVQVLPPPLSPDAEIADQAVPVTMMLDASLFPGQWLVESDPGQADSNQVASEVAESDQEQFVLGKFMLFQTAEQPEQFRQWLDPETFSSFTESVASGDVDLDSDRELYRQYDNIRLLGSVRYGAYTLLYTQFRTATNGELIASVMPARYLDGRLVSAGSLHASSHALYRLLAFGTLQRRLVEYLEARIKN